MNKNNLIDRVLNTESVFEYFEGVSGKKQIFLQSGKCKYSALIHESHLDIRLETVQEGGELEFYLLAPITSVKELEINLEINIKHNGVKIDVHMIALLQEKAPTILNASINMLPCVQNSSASLLEESVILSPKITIKNLPVLDIKAKNIQANHGAKIYRLDGDKLFYLESKGLQKPKAQEVLLSSFPSRLFENVEIMEADKNELYTKYFTFKK